MAWLVLGLRVLLAGMFVIAATLKLLGRESFADTVRDFGIPARLVALVAALVPFAELVLAGWLLTTRQATWGAVGALMLLVAFTVGVVVNLALGRRPDCGCFGDVSRGPIGASTIVRNVTMMAIAAAILLRATTNPEAVSLGLAVLPTALVIVAAACSVVGAHELLLAPTVRQRLHLTPLEVVTAPTGGPAPTYRPRVMPVAGLPVGAPAPSFTLDALEGGTTSLDSLLAPGLPVLLAFVDPRCVRCEELVPYFVAWQRDHAARFTLALITEHSAEENHARFDGTGVTRVLVQRDREVMRDYLVDTTPGMVVIAADGTIASSLARWALDVTTLVERVIAGEVIPLDA